MKSKSEEEWRSYFESGSCNIYQIIFQAIRVAALDDPGDFKLRRKQILEKLYSCQFTGCCCCEDDTELAFHSTLANILDDCKKGCANNNNCTRWHGPDEVEELGHKIEDDNNIIRHVLQIKEQLENTDELTETDIYDSLRRLQLLVLSVDVLQVTKIGSIINDLQQHWSRQISLLARSIVDEWKSMIEESIDTTAETAVANEMPIPDIVLEDWREFPAAEFVPLPPMEFPEFLDDLDDDDENESHHHNHCGASPSERKVDQKMDPEQIKQELIEKLINCKYNRSNSYHGASSSSSKKSHDKIGKMDDGEMQLMEGMKEGKVEQMQQSNSRRVKKGSNDEKKEKHSGIIPTPNLKNSGDGESNVMDEKLEKTKRKLQAGYEAHEHGRRNVQLIREVPKRRCSRRSNTASSANQTRRR